MTPTEHAVIQQALEALEEYRDTQMIKAPRRAITALREAQAGDILSPTEQAEQEPVGMVIGGFFEPWNDDILSGAHELYAAPVKQAEQEPVAWVKFQNGEITHAELSDGSGSDMDLSDWTPLYAAPVRTKDLTDDDLFEIANKVGFDGELMKMNHDRGMPSTAEQYARAVIAADREKNK